MAVIKYLQLLTPQFWLCLYTTQKFKEFICVQQYLFLYEVVIIGTNVRTLNILPILSIIWTNKLQIFLYLRNLL